MIQIQQQLAHLNTVRESLDIISNALNSLKDGTTNIDLSSVISKIEENTAELSNKIEGIQIDTTDLAKEQTLTEISGKLDNLNIDIDLSHISKQGTNTEATNTKILEETLKVSDKIDNIQLPEIDTTKLAKEQTLLDKAEEIKHEVKDLQKIPNEIITLLENRYQFQVNYDGAELNNDGIIQSILGAIINRDAIVTLTDNYVTALPNKKLTELGFTSLKRASFNKVTNIGGTILWGSIVENLSLPSLKSFGYQNFRNANHLKTINLPALEKSGAKDNAVFVMTPNLIDIICGANFQGSQLGFGGENYGWNPTEAMRDDINTLVSNEQDEFGNAIDSNRKQLLYNLRRHMAANLPQLTTEGYTIAFTPQMKEIIEADENTKAAFINKGWTIS